MLLFKIIFTLLPLAFCLNVADASTSSAIPPFRSQMSNIPQATQKIMSQYTWRPGCPVTLNDLAYIKLSHWGFDHKIHTGTLIVHKAVATEVLAIFKELYYQKFLIERMETMDVFKGDDDAAMAANNTSAFNCRAVTGKSNTFSKHSYGRAIDINTTINPYVKGDKVLPPNGRAYLDRSKPRPGMIIANDATHQSFAKRGWKWGGSWQTLKDYQHFEKNID